MSKKDNSRTTLYFSPRKDKDLIQELEGVEVGDISWHIKGLMRDGIKLRMYNNDFIDIRHISHKVSTPAPPPTLVIDDKIKDNNFNQPLTTMSSFNELDSIEVKKKKVSVEEAENLFDKL